MQFAVFKLYVCDIRITYVYNKDTANAAVVALIWGSFVLFAWNLLLCYFTQSDPSNEIYCIFAPIVFTFFFIINCSRTNITIKLISVEIENFPINISLKSYFFACEMNVLVVNTFFTTYNIAPNVLRISAQHHQRVIHKSGLLFPSSFLISFTVGTDKSLLLSLERKVLRELHIFLKKRLRVRISKSVKVFISYCGKRKEDLHFI